MLAQAGQLSAHVLSQRRELGVAAASLTPCKWVDGSQAERRAVQLLGKNAFA